MRNKNLLNCPNCGWRVLEVFLSVQILDGEFWKFLDGKFWKFLDEKFWRFFSVFQVMKCDHRGRALMQSVLSL